MNWLDDDIAARTTRRPAGDDAQVLPRPGEVRGEVRDSTRTASCACEDTNGERQAPTRPRSLPMASAIRSTAPARASSRAATRSGGRASRISGISATRTATAWPSAKDKLLTGFGVKFAFRGHDMHGLRFGPDGKLYFSIGDRAHQCEDQGGRRSWREPETGSIMRCNPDGTGLRDFRHRRAQSAGAGLRRVRQSFHRRQQLRRRRQGALHLPRRRRRLRLADGLSNT